MSALSSAHPARPQLPVTPDGPTAPTSPAIPATPTAPGSAEPAEPEDSGQLDLEDRHALRQLSRLAETAGSQVLDGLIQRRGRPDSATYVGAGKAAELAELVASSGADTVICDGELAPG